jgi:hypothetical protein
LTQEKLNSQLQDRINSIQDQVFEPEIFQDQVLEIHTEIEKEQQEIFSKLEFIQNYFQNANKTLNDILLKEKETKETRTTFQKAVALSAKKENDKLPKLTGSLQIRGDIIIKAWEANLAENKTITKEVSDECQGIFNLMEKASVNIGKDDCSGLLGEINISKHQLRFRENLK